MESQAALPAQGIRSGDLPRSAWSLLPLASAFSHPLVTLSLPLPAWNWGLQGPPRPGPCGQRPQAACGLPHALTT